jgi:hypothetical protein
MPPFSGTLTLALSAAVLNAMLLAPMFLLCRHLIRSFSGWRRMEI